jgi:hypothetical protein
MIARIDSMETQHTHKYEFCHMSAMGVVLVEMGPLKAL